MTQHLLSGGLEESFDVTHFNLAKKRGVETKGVFNLQNLFFGLVQPFGLFRVLLKGDFDIVFTDIAQNTAGFLRYSSFIWLASFFRCKIAVRVMGDGFGHFYERFIFPSLIRATLSRIDRFVVRATVLKSQFNGLVPSERIEVVYSGIPLNEWSAPARNKRKIRFLFVGYLTKAKGAFDFLHAIPSIRSQVPNSEFVFVGPRVESKERNIVYIESEEIKRDQGDVLDEILAMEELGALVNLKGTLSGEAKVSEYLSADVFVFPSYAEAFPTVVLEAMAARLPILTTRVGALPELFSEEEIKYVNVGDIEQIIDGCVELAQDSALRERLGQQGRLRMEKEFNVLAYVNSTRKMLLDVVETRERKAKVSSLRVEGKASTRVVLFGHYGGNNTGDEAMLEAILRELPIERVKCRVLGKTSQTLERWKAICFRECSVFELLRSVFWCDVFCIGGGTHFHDDYTDSRYRRHFLYMARIMCLGALARLLGKKFFMIGAGIGPFQRSSAKLVTRMTLACANEVVVRDSTSFREAEECLPNCRSVLGFDLVGLLPISENISKNKNRIAISLAYSDSFSIEGLTSDEWWSLFGDELVKLGKANPQLLFTVIVFRGGSRESDEELSRETVQRLCDGLGKERVTLFEHSDDPLMMLEVIAECGSMIATRYHAALMGYVARCSLLLLCYHRKLVDLAADVELPPEACIDFRSKEGRSRLRGSLQGLVRDTSLYRAQIDPDESRLLAQLNFANMNENFK